jgi:hypothetical protein
VKDLAERGAGGLRVRAKIEFLVRLFVPTDGTRLPIVSSGDFGASPFLRQLSGKQSACRHMDVTLFPDQCPCLLWVSFDRVRLLVRCPIFPDNDQKADIAGGPLSANSCREQMQHGRRYSITSSAVNSNLGGMVRPSALAVLTLMISSNLVGCSTGRSAGFAPLKILSA